MNCTDATVSVIYAEARGETDLGMKGVAHVILNRAKEQQKPACQVVKQRGQFAKGLYRPKDPNWQLAKKILLNPGRDFTRGATYFHSLRMRHRPHWAKYLKVTYRYKGHVFYSA